MIKSSSSRKKALGRGAGGKRDATTGRFTGVIDEVDAIKFRMTDKAYVREATSSKAKAIKALKASGYLTQTGEISKRYR